MSPWPPVLLAIALLIYASMGVGAGRPPKRNGSAASRLIHEHALVLVLEPLLRLLLLDLVSCANFRHALPALCYAGTASA